MKRKNPEFAKARRFIRKAKFSENLSSTSYLYIKLFMLWLLVVMSDFLIEFRFEYLWAFYLYVRNVYDIFKYQGFAFSALFVFITLTSNAIWFFLMPVQWLFFTASIYVWFQYIWNNSEKGICLQTFIVWLIFVYVEATVRLKDLKNISSHLNLCRPMAAQCIGYPFVTLGFGFKKYLNYKIIMRRQKEVEVENELIFSTINRLHHLEHLNSDTSAVPPITGNNNYQISNLNQHHSDSRSEPAIEEPAVPISEQLFEQDQFDNEKRISNIKTGDHDDPSPSNIVLILEKLFILMTTYLNAIFRKFLKLTYLYNQFRAIANPRTPRSQSNKCLNSLLLIENNPSSIQDNHNSSLFTEVDSTREQQCLSSGECNHLSNREPITECGSSVDANLIMRLDKLKKIKQENKNEIKKLKSELQTVRQSEQDYKEKVSKLTVSRNEFKFQCSKLQNDNTMLQEKLAAQLISKNQDKNLINELEKKLQDERKLRMQIEKQMSKYSKVVECGEACKQKRLEYENCIHKLHEQINLKDTQLSRVNEEAFGNKTLLLSAVDKLQARNAILEGNLREETKLKLELFSVLGDTRRQLEVNHIVLMQKTNEVEELSCKLSELMAVIPNADPYAASFLPNFINQRVNQTVNTSNDQTATSSSSTLNNLKQKSATISSASESFQQQTGPLKRNMNGSSNTNSNNASTNSNKLSVSLTASSTNSSSSPKDVSLD